MHSNHIKHIDDQHHIPETPMLEKIRKIVLEILIWKPLNLHKIVQAAIFSGSTPGLCMLAGILDK